MPHKVISVGLLALFLLVPSFSHAAENVKKSPVQAATVCVSCRSLAEGADTSKASKAKSWVGTIIGINAGSHDVIITEAIKLNRIKAFQQRNIVINDKTKIVIKNVGEDSETDNDEKKFEDLDIGYRVYVTGSYDAKKRTITAASVEIREVPKAPVTKTK